MPGIFGAYKKTGKETLSGLMEKMIRSMNHKGKLKIDRFVDENRGLCMGRVSLGTLNPVDQPIKVPEENCVIVFHGELYDKVGSATDPEYVLEQYIKKGDQCASELNGIFHFAVYDRRSEQLKLFSDKFGLQPLYSSILPDGLVFGAEVKALLADENIPKEPDYRSFADFFHYGQILGEKTLFREIKLLPPGSILTFDLRTNRVNLKKYFAFDQLFVEKGQYDPLISSEDVVSLLIKSIRARAIHKELLGISLSGGLDSRGILAGLSQDAEGIYSYTLGLPGCADEKLAGRMAQVAMTNHEFIELDKSYLQDFEKMALDMTRLSDGMYHPHESTEMLALEYFKRARFKILLRGHGGEIAKAALAYPVMVSQQVYSFSDSKEILNYIYNRTNLVIRDIDPMKFFSPSFHELMSKTPMSSLKESCGKASEILAPADVCLYYYINEHIRRQVVASLDIFRTQVEIRMPYVDEAYIKGLLKLPVDERNNGEIHFKLIERCMPEMIKIPNSNTGAPLDAGRLRLLVTEKFNSLMKRLSVRGFRHYTEFQKWHREAFRESSRKIIFSEQVRERNIYNMDHLKSIFDLHIEERKDYGHLIGTIIGLELWFRRFVD